MYQVIDEARQPRPTTRGELVRAVLESLALEYAWRLDLIDRLTNEKTEQLYMVGGGIANTLLCQFTADACGIPVHAGADQCTSLGNALTQAVAMRDLSGGDEIRQVMRNSFELKTYDPTSQSLWKNRLASYMELQK